MEKIKKIIHQKTKIVKIVTPTGTTYNILPDLSVNYNVKLSLVVETHDLGFFDPYVYDEAQI